MAKFETLIATNGLILGQIKRKPNSFIFSSQEALYRMYSLKGI